MIIRCSCGFAGNVPDWAAGQKIVCRQCGSTLTATPTHNLTPQQIQQAHAQQFAFDQHQGSAVPMIKPYDEPWYYGFCYMTTMGLLWFCLILAPLGLLAWIGMTVLAAVNSKNSEGMLAFGLLGFVIQLFFVVLGVLYLLYTFSFVLIFIDAARKVGRILDVLQRR